MSIIVSMSRLSSKMDIITTDYSIPYGEIIRFMKQSCDYVKKNNSHLLLVLQHEACYTVSSQQLPGKKIDDIEIKNEILPLYSTDRGGKITYHGPQQKIFYPIFFLPHLYENINLKDFIDKLEYAVVLTLRDLGITAFQKNDARGVWVKNSINEEAKIASIGMRFSNKISHHGIAINISDCNYYLEKINACGIIGGRTACVADFLNENSTTLALRIEMLFIKHLNTFFF
ncbi:Octanoyltransferase [Candidatus Fokinia solitaria]|uniref:Octanoyltransferase n=2 Tax=Candidatus Fokinia solitaria TaxID=1802984 RepID=A0A2U8BRU9_9RICK|nr:Octanoyltransferase [Candidatus Fokinia solitaria]